MDACLGRLAAAVTAAGGCLLITSDHGNAEQMDDPATGQPHTAHTMNKVPLILAGDPLADTSLADTPLADGRLADIAPTILEIMGLPIPPAMTGRPLLRAAKAAAE